ncbi:MAG: TlpA family protein disulfide reductase [Sphingomonadales bacterium]|nr:TlpA family protein disulfide reductase [Sphingomonadales bacterium]MBD3772730.1 TlpA family protein disulfide reductase [Paracoccaceae bacterium]
MDGVVQLGPLALATDRLLAVGLIFLFVLAMDRIALRAGKDATRASGLALAAGVIVARAAYVVQHWAAFAQDWGSALAIWQGGFLAWAGLLAAAMVIAWRMRPPRAMLQAVAVLLMLGATWYAGSALLRPAPRPMSALPVLARLDGTVADRQSLAAKPYVLNLWATWCPPCRRELPMLADAAEKSDIPILLVNQGESAAQVAEYLRKNGVDGAAVVLDPAAALSAATGGKALPTTIFVDARGMIVATHVGELSRAMLESELAALSPAKE